MAPSSESSSPPEDGAGSGPYRYAHRERAVLRLRPRVSGFASSSSSSSLQASAMADVVLESHSSLVLRDGSRGLDEAASPFPDRVASLLLENGVERALLRVGSSSSSSGGGGAGADPASIPWPKGGGDDDGDIFAGVGSRDVAGPSWSPGPAGTSVYARFSSPSPRSSPRGGDNVEDRARDAVSEQSPRHALRRRFRSLLRSLSGSRLSCAPLDSLSVPKHGHRPAILPPFLASDPPREVEATLSAEGGSLCAESLGAFRDLAGGCRDRSGVMAGLADASSLLLGEDPKSAGGSPRGMWIDMTASRGCFSEGRAAGEAAGEAGEDCTLSVRQGVRYSVRINAATGENDAARVSMSLAHALRPTKAKGGATKKSFKACPLADSSWIQTVLPRGAAADGAGANFVRPPTSREDVEGAGQVVAHDLHSLGELDTSKEWLTATLPQPTLAPDAGAFGGWGVERTISRPRGVAHSGTVHTSYRSGAGGPCERARVRTTDVLPDLVRPVLHTMRAGVYEGGGAGHPDFVPGNNGLNAAVRAREVPFVDLRSHGVTPALTFTDDGSLVIELDFTLAPDSSLWLSVDYEPSYLPFERFPSDPNRGVDLSPSVGRFVCVEPPPPPPPPREGSERGYLAAAAAGARLYSPSVLLLPPVPDMSMPFNVISLTCTVYAFVIGSMVNFLVRKSTQSVSDALKGKKEKTKLQKLKEKVRGKLRRLLGKKRGRDAKEEEEEEAKKNEGEEGESEAEGEEAAGEK